MSFIDCILQNKALSQKQQEQLVGEYEKILDQNTKKYGTIDAPAMAAQHYIKLKSDILTQKAENTVRDALGWQYNKADMDKIAEQQKVTKSKTGKLGSKLFFKSKYAAAAVRKFEDLSTKIGSANDNTLRAIAESVEKYRSKKAGFTQDTEGFKDVTAELLGKKTGNAEASGAAKGIREVFDSLHSQYQNLGGIIGKLQNYYPQSHNPFKVAKATLDQWKADIRPLLDLGKMVNSKTWMPLSEKELDAALDDAYSGITTNGLDEIAAKAQEGKVSYGGSFASRRSSARFLHFIDADSFFAYNAKYGNGDEGLFDAMLGHIYTMTRDIEIMRELGPNPEAQFKRIMGLVIGDDASGQAQATIKGMYDTVVGRNSYQGNTGWLTGATQNTQNFLRGVLLGGAPISAIGDSFWAGMTAKMNGLPVASVMKNYFGYLNPASSTDRRIASRVGYVAGAANGGSLAQARFSDNIGTGKMAFFANAVHRASGLSVMTDAVRNSVVTSAQGFMAEAKHIKMNFADLPDAMQDALARWGMNELDYKNITKATAHIADENGADFIRPEDVALIDVDTARKYGYWLYDMSQKASNEPALLTRAITTGAVFGEAKVGTGLRGTASTVMMFKSFGITVFLNHILPSLQHTATTGKLGRAATILVGTTIIGAASIQARNVLYGKTPQDMEDYKFWQAAALQGGGFGIFGDFAFADTNRFGYSLGATLAGPGVQLGSDVLKLFKGNFDDAVEDGEESKFFADLSKLGQRYSPKLWYTRLLQERLVFDQLNRMQDPLYDTKMRRIENKMTNEKKQEFWWNP